MTIVKIFSVIFDSKQMNLLKRDALCISVDYAERKSSCKPVFAVLEEVFMNLLNISEVAEMLRCSVATIRRRLAEARRGERRFPLPVNKWKEHNLWRAVDIENWTENPIQSKTETTKQTAARQRSETAGLARHGITAG
jgi:predicted DNA-binding transcriptional regulator AlpA